MGRGSHDGEGTGWRHQVSKQQLPGGIAMTSFQTEIFPFQSKHVRCYFCQKKKKNNQLFEKGEEGKYFLTKYLKYCLSFTLPFF